MALTRNCKHCNLVFLELSNSLFANHVRWCKENPKRQIYIETLLWTYTDDRRKKVSESIKSRHKEWRYKEVYEKAKFKSSLTWWKHTESDKKRMSEIALNNPYQRKCKKTSSYIQKDWTVVSLDSSWEIFVAVFLDKYNISWSRPKPIKWNDKEWKSHNYFADFYLLDYDLYLDPKNEYVLRVQKEKIDILLSTYSNIVILEEKHLNEEYLKELLKLNTATLESSIQ